MKIKLVVSMFGLFLLGGCKSATRAQFESLGSKHRITCYSGDRVIYQGESDGNVSNEAHSDGWYWRDTATSKLVEVTGPCVIEQE